jgi:hypothetical protein
LSRTFAQPNGFLQTPPKFAKPAQHFFWDDSATPAPAQAAWIANVDGLTFRLRYPYPKPNPYAASAKSAMTATTTATRVRVLTFVAVGAGIGVLRE